MTNVDKKWEHPCDEAIKDYAVCDHNKRIVKEIQFKINPTLLNSRLEVKKIHSLDNPTPAAEGEQKHHCSAAPVQKPIKVYSVTDHFRRAEEQSNVDETSTRKD